MTGSGGVSRRSRRFCLPDSCHRWQHGARRGGRRLRRPTIDGAGGPSLGVAGCKESASLKGERPIRSLECSYPLKTPTMSSRFGLKVDVQVSIYLEVNVATRNVIDFECVNVTV